MSEVTEPQKCFWNAQGLKLCNWKYIHGVPTKTSSGKWWIVDRLVELNTQKQKETVSGKD